MKRLLVPTDFSPASEDALKLASSIADKSGAEIYLVNFTEHPFDESFTTTGDMRAKFDDEETLFTVQLIRRNNERLQALATKYTEGRVINIQVYGQDLVDGVEEYVHDKNIDLIVMGTTGEETAREFFTGNHTEQIIEKATVPVLSLRSGQENVNFENVVVGIELDSDSKDNFRAATQHLNAFAAAMSSKLHLVHISKPGDKNRDEVEAQIHSFAKKFNIENYTSNLHYSDDIEDGLTRFARLNEAGIIAVLSHAEGGFFRIFSSSVSEELSKESEVPVLSINLHNV
ncbi:universal stress protein [Fulvivirga sedimenti]|uniref:Universal stress protein n=1 Tax=Fulvivirga sedimenti TaxID=2879465 RepID=A0A9X1HR70_9BACT|nr:universal stress protein [Fulvivirga sedimenti]MCA6074864.1 universal stress protein [Fulvivirga sedimenti]MCA6076041.1 universal stress protein [Fulvivirga sedimenti]MCA6077169.1 universal stress protein [Fulvivirga sedimenti]